MAKVRGAWRPHLWLAREKLKQGERAQDEVPHVAPEIDENGKQRAEMRHDVGELALVRPMHQIGDQDEMP